MANKTNSTTNFFETMVDASSKAMDTLVENTKKFAQGNPMVNETIDKTTEFFKKTTEASKENMNKAKSQAETVQTEMKSGSDKMNEYFNNWKSQQMEWAKQMQDMNSSFLKNSMNPTNFQNPMSNIQNAWSNMGNQFDMNTMMNQMNPANMKTQMDAASEQMKSFWNQFQQSSSTKMQDMMGMFQNGNIADTYKGMFNMSEGFAKFYEMWMPMMKSMNEKSFNMDMFAKNLDMNKYKEFMDKYFSFMPQANQDYMNTMKDMMGSISKNGTSQMSDMMNNMKGSMMNMMPNMMSNPYSNMLLNYNNMNSQMMNAVSPFAKLMSPNDDSKNMQAWAEIMNNMNIYNIKNAELQHMVYQTGMNVMEKLASQTMHKIENGEEVNSMIKLYQDYLNTSDKMFVGLFETDEYSKLMSEVSAMKLSIKKAVEKQSEKMFDNIPVATRSEMDEVYQTLYDLKKMVRTLEAKLNNEPEAPKKSAPVAKKASPAKAKLVVKKATIVKKVIAKKKK
jgi:polyhydroxyalkanoate synthase subunit PhaE